METYRMKDKLVTVVAIDTDGLKAENDILCVSAKKFKIIRSEDEYKLELIDVFERYYVPDGDLNIESQKYHKWEKRELIKRASSQARQKFDKNECTELLTFAKGSLIVTNSKDFLRKMIWQYTSHSQAKQIKSNRVLGLVEDTKPIIKKEGQFGIINPNIYDIMDYYAVVYEENQVMNAHFKMELTAEVFTAMLAWEQELVKIRFANKINLINVLAIENWEFEFKYGEDALKKKIYEEMIPPCIWDAVKKYPEHFSKIGVSHIPLRMLGIKKGYKSSLNGLSNALSALVFKVKGVYFFVRCDNGKLIGISERKLDLNVGYSGEDVIFTDSITEYIKGIYNYENIRFVPFSLI